MAKITVSFMRDVLEKLQKEEITFGRMVELINERAEEEWLGISKIYMEGLRPEELAYYREMYFGAIRSGRTTLEAHFYAKDGVGQMGVRS